MSLPFNPRTAQLRDPFACYLTDPMALDMARQVADEMGWPHERLHDGALRIAAQDLALAPSPAVLLVDLSDAADPLNDIDALAEVCEPGTIVIACGPINDVGFYRALIGSGVHDYLATPFTLEELRDAVHQANAALADVRGEAVIETPHLSAHVIGVRGGVGATSIATSLAWGLSQGQRTTALLDLDVHFGTGALQLDLEPGRGLTDAIENPGRIDGLFLERAMVRASPHLSVLSAEAPIHQPLPNDGAAFLQLQEELRRNFATTVTDLPRHMLVQHPALLGDAGVAIVVAELGLAATRDTIRVLAGLKSVMPRLPTLVVVNKAPPGPASEISVKDFEASIERPVDLAIPADAKLAVQAAKLGKPLAEVARGSKLGTALAELGPRVLVASGEEGAAERPRARSLLGRLGDLKTLLPKKPRQG